MRCPAAAGAEYSTEAQHARECSEAAAAAAAGGDDKEEAPRRDNSARDVAVVAVSGEFLPELTDQAYRYR